ncbi:hypothetical protein OOZ63_28825 [Paucibacter sp. PLA-PC-4]|uniref:hypothetical protein n=1 Tax=Paucibacter sp. PLA-PC-4 TaxID=2993655 RepID=UPI00224B3077|nr:hypothetical protein [Paucibacter sp. PLA-PC-4]MCX2865829.1 hypothetical protein [Paucibacter sp. PLA-PC-4]
MSSTAVLLLVALVAMYAAFAIPVMLRFRSYCRHVANATNRISELNDQRSIDDGGSNAFEREQWWSLASGDFQEFTDPNLIAEAATLSKKVRLSMALAVGLVVAFPFIAGLR